MRDKRTEGIINEAHQKSPYPTVAVIAASAQDLRNGDCAVFIGSGESSYEAVWNALGKAKLAKLKDWVAVVHKVDAQGRLIEPSTMEQAAMPILKKEGMLMVEYIGEDGVGTIYTP